MRAIDAITISVAALCSLATAAPTVAIESANTIERRTPTPAGGFEAATAPHSGPCQAPTDYFILYDAFSAWDPDYPLNAYWSFETDAGLTSTREVMGELPWAPNGSLKAWHVRPDPENLPANKTEGFVSARASTWVCIPPGHQYNFRVPIGGIKDAYPKDAIFNADIDGAKGYDNWHVCDFPWKCPGDYSNDYMKMREGNDPAGDTILPVFTDSLVNLPGPRSDEGQWMKATFQFDWPVDKLNSGNHGVWMTRVYLRTWS